MEYQHHAKPARMSNLLAVAMFLAGLIGSTTALASAALQPSDSISPQEPYPTIIIAQSDSSDSGDEAPAPEPEPEIEEDPEC